MKAYTKTTELKKSNRVGRANFQCTLTQKRVLEYSLSLINPKEDWITIDPIKYSVFFGIRLANAYRDIISGSEYLNNLTIDILQEDKSRKVIKIFSDREYSKRQGHVRMMISSDYKAELIGINNNEIRYFFYNLTTASKFSDPYTWKLYEVISSWAEKKGKNKGKGRIIQTFEDLRACLGVPTSYTYSKFNKRILSRSIKDLKKIAGINVKSKITKKKGKKVEQLQISFVQKKNSEALMNIEANTENKTQADNLANNINKGNQQIKEDKWSQYNKLVNEAEMQLKIHNEQRDRNVARAREMDNNADFTHDIPF